MDHIAKLKRILAVSGSSQQALANRLGVSFATLNSWINGRSTPRARALVAIDAAFTEFVGGSSLDVAELGDLINLAGSQRFTLSQLTNDRQALDHFSVLMTYHTDAIEGSTMTVAETEAVLTDNKSLSNRTFVEQLEAKNHQAALFWLIDELGSKEFAVTEDAILNLHVRLMNGVISDAGHFRRHTVRIANTRVTVANHLRVPDLVQQLCSDVQQKDETAIAYLARHHAVFERIHPFSDGNGRVGRLLLFALAIQRKLTPPLVRRERRAIYYAALEAAQVHEDFEPLQQFLAETIVATQRDLFG